MSPPLRGVVVGHGDLAAALVAAAEEISGVRDVLVAVSNRHCDRVVLETRVKEAVGSGPAVVFVDLPSGSCFFAAMHGVAGVEGVQIIAGVNLSMLVDFVFHREAGLEAAVRRARDIGSKAIAGPR